MLVAITFDESTIWGAGEDKWDALEDARQWDDEVALKTMPCSDELYDVVRGAFYQSHKIVDGVAYLHDEAV